MRIQQIPLDGEDERFRVRLFDELDVKLTIERYGASAYLSVITKAGAVYGVRIVQLEDILAPYSHLFPFVLAYYQGSLWAAIDD